jgi:hypothetical protein
MKSRHVGALALGLFMCAAVPVPAPAAIGSLPSGTPQIGPPLIPAHVRLTVTGDPATPEFLTEQIRAAVLNALPAELTGPSGALNIGPILPRPAALASGFLTTFRVAVQVDPGGGAAPVAAQTTVDVNNAGLPGFLPERLSFRDDPERITTDGVLSRTTVVAGQPGRLYYYHENRGERRRFCVVLSANDSVRTRVQIVAAGGGPDIDVMGVGHAVTKTFLTVQPHNEGIVVDIAGGKPILERDVPVGPGAGIVGSLDLNVLEGGPLTATVMAIPPGAEPVAYLYALKRADDGHLRHGSFDLRGFAQRVIAYTAGGHDVTYVYASRRSTPAPAASGESGHDYGDYGVVGRVWFDLDNPSPAPATLYLYEQPLGGAVRSSFLVNGTVVEVGCVRVPHHYLIASYTLGPHAIGRIELRTMTDGGSNYPLEIGLTTIAPLSAAPPIFSADGCFPKPGGAAASAQPGGGPGGQ